MVHRNSAGFAYCTTVEELTAEIEKQDANDVHAIIYGDGSAEVFESVLGHTVCYLSTTSSEKAAAILKAAEVPF